jgi:tRNA(adenine34) deaminase
MCAEALIQSRVAKVVYGAPDLMYGAIGSAFNLFVPGRTFPIPEVIGGIKAEESSRMLKDFFRHQRAVKEAAKKALKEGL